MIRSGTPKRILITLFAITIACFVLVLKFSWEGLDGKGYTRIIESDGKGYYMYLPSLFINGNISNQVPDQRFIFKTTNGTINKYYAGTAFCMSPFFACAYITAKLNGDTLDGYSPTFQKAIGFAGLFYLLFGLFFLSKFLLLYEINPNVVCITLLSIVFGTNLLMYAVYHPSFSHIYSFCFITAFLYFAKQYGHSYTNRYLIFTAISFGMILIIRPSNGIVVLLLPFICGSLEAFKKFIATSFQLKNIAPALLALFLIISVQAYLWYLQTGDLMIWSYQHEGFYFLHPAILKTLFSFRKGFFIYTPLALLTLAGIIFIYRKNKFGAISISLFTCILIYITAAWWCWYYGPSFGQRSFIDFYAINALLLAITLTELNKIRIKQFFYALLFLLITFNLVQSYQYVKGILSSWDMSGEKYKYVFLKTGKEYYSNLGGCRDIKPYGKDTLLFELKNDYEKKYDLWNESRCSYSDDEHKNSADFSGIEFNSGIEITGDFNITKQRLLFAEIELEQKERTPSVKEGAVLAISLSDSQNNSYSYYSFPLNEVPNNKANEWKKHRYTVEIPHLKAFGDKLRIYIWNPNKRELQVDNFQIRLSGIN